MRSKQTELRIHPTDKSKLVVVMVAIFMVLWLSGCQMDMDLGTYATPRLSTKIFYKGESETVNHQKGRDTGVFGNGHTVTISERANSNNFRLPMIGDDK